jgi:hypothetical protein
MARTDDPHHQELEHDVITYGTTHGWQMGAGTYHSVMPERTIRALQCCWDPTALHVRARADRVAVKDQFCLLWEGKTNSGSKDRALFEALPLAFYVWNELRCLYIYRDVVRGYESAFWTTRLPEFFEILIPPRHPELHPHYRAMFARVWPSIQVTDFVPVNGSGDPFIAVTRDRLAACAVDWREVFAGTGHDDH